MTDVSPDELTDWLGPAPSSEQTECLEQQNNRRLEIKELFEDWFYELVGFSFRSEWFCDDFDHATKTKDYKRIIKWLRTAYKVGYEEGQRLYGGTE